MAALRTACRLSLTSCASSEAVDVEGAHDRRMQGPQETMNISNLSPDDRSWGFETDASSYNSAVFLHYGRIVFREKVRILLQPLRA